ncbi:MAG: fluoride efflux transporter CrcB [Spirochaetales bacterium]|nr:MAG: fluoride efflux transporter CrcB [Spirochaetales bacterium]
MTLVRILSVALGGAAGAVLRYSVSHFLAQLVRSPFPAGTFVVNILGCLVIGFLMAGPSHMVSHPETQAFLVAGLLGAFTTFSTFSLETVILLQRGSFVAGVLNIGASLVVGLAAVIAGGALARLAARVF